MRPLAPIKSSLAFAFALVIALALPAHAQWSSSASTNLNVSTSSTLSGNPSNFAFPDHAGGMVLAWGDGRGTVVQRLDAFGNKMWGANAKVISQTNLTFAPRAITDDAGGVIAGWTETATGHTGFYVQRVDRKGTALWPAGGIAVNATGLSSALCSDGADGAIVVWVAGNNIMANRITAAGTLPWGAAGKTVYTSNDIKIVDLAVPSASNGAILAWHNYLSVNLVDPDTLSFQRIDGSGNNAWAAPGLPGGVRVITLDDTSIDRSCVGASGSAFFTTLRGDSCYLHRLQTTGAFASPVVGWPVAGPTTSHVKIAVCNAMIPDGSGGVVLSWRDESLGAGIGRIRAQRMNASGTRLWPTSGGTFVQVCPSSNDENFSNIVRDGYGNYVFGWEDYRNGVNINLWAEKLDPATGAPLWTTSGIFFASATDNQFWPKLAPGNPGNILAGFDDARTGSGKLYAQCISPTGTLTLPNPVAFVDAVPSPIERSTSGYATVGGQLFVEGGGGTASIPIANTLGIYTLGSPGSWNTPAGTYVNRWFGNLAYVPETGKLYALNGNDNISVYHSTVEEIALGGGAATLRATNPRPREGAGVTVAGGKIYVVSGNNDNLGGLQAKTFAFDPVANSWDTTRAVLATPRIGLTATAYNGVIYAFGGWGATGVATNEMDRYNIATDTWLAPAAPAPLPIAWHAAAVTGGLIWYAGDYGTGWTLMSYAPALDAWTVYTTNMWSRRFGCLGAVGNTLIVTGGALGTTGAPSISLLDTQTADVSALVAATPLAVVTLPVSALENQLLAGDLAFAAPGESTLVTINFGSVAGAGTATVKRFTGPPTNVSFSSATPTTVGTTRWEISESGLSPLGATVKIQLYGLPDALGPGSGIGVYRRATPGSGPFAYVPTSYDATTHRVQATATGVGEFILGSGGNVAVPEGGEAAIALAIRPFANPAHGAPAFRLSLPAAAAARLELFDLAGRVVASRAVSLGAGEHTLRLGGGRALASGLYFARLTQGAKAATTRLVVQN